MAIWLLEDPTDPVELDDPRIKKGDHVLRPTDGAFEVGVAQPDRHPPVEWFGTVDRSLIPNYEAGEEGRVRRLANLPELDALVHGARERDEADTGLPGRGPSPPT